MKVGDIIKVRKSVPSLRGRRGVILGFVRGENYHRRSPKAVVHLFDDPAGKKHRYLKTHNLKKHKVPDYNSREICWEPITWTTQKVKKNGNVKITYRYQDGRVALAEEVSKRS